MRIVLVGPGALGSLFTVRLSPHLQEESNALFLLDHNPQRAAELAQSGFTLQQNNTSTPACFPRVTSDPNAIPACDVLLLCVKSGEVSKALNNAKPLITAETLVIGLQNGMAHLEALQKTAGIAVAATSSEGATLQAPGRVIHGGTGLTRLGLLDTNAPVPDSLQTLITLFIRAGLQAEIVPDIHNYLWGKLFINVGINALTAIHGQKNGWLLTSDQVMSTMRDAVAEAVAVAEQKNIGIPDDPLEQTIEVCTKTANNVSSMLQDVRRKRPTEIAAINGYIVREGEKLGIPSPVNAALVRQVREIELSWQHLTSPQTQQ